MHDIKEVGMIPPPYGGASVFISRLINSLTEDGYSVGGYYMPFNQGNCSSELFDEWSWFETVKFPYKVFKYWRQFAPYRIIHSHLSLEGMIYFWTTCAIQKKKVVVTVHNSMAVQYWTESNIVNRFFLRLMAINPNVTWIAVSEQAKEEMMKLPVRFKDDIQVIPAYIPSKLSSSTLSESIQSYIQDHSWNLVFYGHSFMYHAGADVYGFEKMLSAFARIHNRYGNRVGLLYCIAEVSNQVAIDSVLVKADALGIKDAIFWQLGPVSSMSPLWESADVYVRPTSTDGDSVAVREALSMGCQVVASNVCERPKGCLLFDFTSDDDLFNAIELALQAGRRTVEQDYSFYHKMKEVYDSILKYNTCESV